MLCKTLEVILSSSIVLNYQNRYRTLYPHTISFSPSFAFLFLVTCDAHPLFVFLTTCTMRRYPLFFPIFLPLISVLSLSFPSNSIRLLLHFPSNWSRKAPQRRFIVAKLDRIALYFRYHHHRPFQ